MAEYDPETHVAVPKSALEQLEKDRVRLYEVLQEEGYFGTGVESYMKISSIQALTQKMWEIANSKKW